MMNTPSTYAACRMAIAFAFVLAVLFVALGLAGSGPLDVLGKLSHAVHGWFQDTKGVWG